MRVLKVSPSLAKRSWVAWETAPRIFPPGDERGERERERERERWKLSSS